VAHGAAGAGKSAIAHTLAELCEHRGWLVASFFFWKKADERNNVNRFVAIIAQQVAQAIPASRELIEAAVDYNPFVFQKSIDVQLSKLVIEPLQQLSSAGIMFDTSPLVIIVDGLDECQCTDIQSGLIKSLTAGFCGVSFRIRILMASRPEVYLKSTFNSSVRPHLARLALSDEYSSEKDIYRFLKDSFDKIKKTGHDSLCNDPCSRKPAWRQTRSLAQTVQWRRLCSRRGSVHWLWYGAR